MRPFSIPWLAISAIRNDVDVDRPRAGRDPLRPRSNRPRSPPSKRLSTRHSPRGGGNDVVPRIPRSSSPSIPDDENDPPSRPSPYDYVPVAALDDYGRSVQLRHAMRAPSRRGAPLLACLCRVPSEDEEDSRTPVENAVAVVSLQKHRAGIVSPDAIPPNSKRRPPHSSVRGTVRPLAVRDDAPSPSGGALRAALVAVGLSSDADFVSTRLRRYCVSRYWFRYDALPPSRSADGDGEVVRAIRRILLDFLGYDWSREVGSAAVSGGIGGDALGGEEDEGGEEGDGTTAARAGRPLGVSVLVLGFDDGRRPSLTVVRANGSSEGYVAHAMGVGSEEGNERLCRLWRRGMTVEEATGMMREILKEIAVERGWLEEDGGVGGERHDFDAAEETTLSADSEFTLVCETVTSRGIDIEYLKL